MMDWLLRHWKVNLALMVLLLAGGVAAVVNDIAQSPSDQHSAAIWSAVLGGLAGLVLAFASFGANMLFAPDRITRDPDRQRRNARTGLGIGLPLALVLIVAANSFGSSFESAFLAGCIGFLSGAVAFRIWFETSARARQRWPQAPESRSLNR
jgi:membrane associated rhomboid family serine protease